MKISKLKKFDKIFGILLIYLFLPIAFLFTKSFCNRKSSKSPKRIVLLKLFGMGSLVIFYKNIQIIKSEYPNCELNIITTKNLLEISKFLNLNNISIINHESIFSIVWSSLTALKENINSDILINLEVHSKLASLFTFLNFPKDSYSLVSEFNWWQKYFTNNALFYNFSNPIYEAYDGLTYHISEKSIDKSIYSSLIIKRLNDIKSKLQINDRYILLSPYCSDLCEEREFNLEILSNLVYQYKAKNLEIVLVGSERDKEKSYKLQQFVSNQINLKLINFVGKTSFVEYIKLVYNAELVITIDTATVHIARLLRKKTISYWGPTNPFNLLRDIDNKLDLIYYNKLTCSPCVHYIDKAPCNGNNLCMKSHFEKINHNLKLFKING